MELKLIIETDELYGEDGLNFESLLSESFKRAIIKDCKDGLASDKFKEFSQLASDTIIADIKLRMENFLNEEIALTGRYGEKMFVGSIEDLIKQRFDDVLLRPVDGSGKTLQGCTSAGKTWIEWSIEQNLEAVLKRHIKTASDKILKEVEKRIAEQLKEIMDNGIKERVGRAFADILSERKPL